MPILYVHEGAELDIDDLSLDSWVTIQKATGRLWRDCRGANMFEDAEVGRAVLQECATQSGHTLPSPLKISALFEMFKIVPADNRPSEFNDGVPDPKASDSEAETT